MTDLAKTGVLNSDADGWDQRRDESVDGWKVLYDRECPFEMRFQESLERPQHVGTLQAIKVKILVKIEDEQEPLRNIVALKTELCNEDDLFFHYVHFVDQEKFYDMKKKQKLMVAFDEYPNVLIRMLNSCIHEPHFHLAIMVVQQQEGVARLDFIKNMEYKFVELLTCTFEKSDEETIKKSITFRFNALKSRLHQIQARVANGKQPSSFNPSYQTPIGTITASTNMKA